MGRSWPIHPIRSVSQQGETSLTAQMFTVNGAKPPAVSSRELPAQGINSTVPSDLRLISDWQYSASITMQFN